MCNWVKHSCAKPKDQVIAYDRWVKSGEEENLKQRVHYYNGIYDKLMDNFLETFTKATNLMKKRENEEDNNCTLISKRII